MPLSVLTITARAQIAPDRIQVCQGLWEAAGFEHLSGSRGGFLRLDQWNGGGVSYVLTDCKTRRAVCINGRRRHSCARAESGVGALWRTASRPPVGAVSRPTCRARSCDASSAARRRHVRAPRPGSAGSGQPGSRSRAAGARGGGAMAGGPQENTLLHLFAGGWVWRAAPEASSAAVRTPGAFWGRGAAAVGCF